MRHFWFYICIHIRSPKLLSSEVSWTWIRSTVRDNANSKLPVRTWASLVVIPDPESDFESGMFHEMTLCGIVCFILCNGYGHVLQVWTEFYQIKINTFDIGESSRYQPSIYTVITWSDFEMATPPSLPRTPSRTGCALLPFIERRIFQVMASELFKILERLGYTLLVDYYTSRRK